MKRPGSAQVMARWSARHPWRAIAGWLVFVVACVAVGGAVGSKQLTDAETGSGESRKADLAIEAAQFPTDVTENILVQSPDGPLDPNATRQVLQELTRALTPLPAVASVGKSVASQDGHSVLVPVELNSGGTTGYAAVDYAAERVQPVLDVTESVQEKHPDLIIEQMGDASIEQVLGDQLDSDFQKAEFLSLPITLLILLIAFGALFAAGVPVLLALTAVASAIGLSALVSQIFPVTEELASVVLLIGMAVGVDYSLFYVRRAREERLAGATSIEAVEIAAATSGRAVIVSGVAVMVAMSGMFISGNTVFVSFAIGTILVVGAAMLGSLTVLPAVLARFGHRMDRPRVPLIHRLRRAYGHSRVWPRLMRVVLARPLVALSVGTLALLVLAAPALSMQLRDSGSDSLPRSLPIVQTFDRVVAAYPSQGTAHTVAFWSKSPLDRTAVAATVASLRAEATGTELFASLERNLQVQYSPDGRVATVDLPMTYDESDPRARDSLDILRNQLIPDAARALSSDVEVGVTGPVATSSDFVSQMSSRLPYVMGFVLVLSFLVLLFAFRSLVVAATAIALNLLSVAAAYGLLVIVFQNQWAEGLLGFQSNGAVISWLPLFLFVVLFGLSMDYHVFVVTRIREAAMRGLTTRDAIAEGVTSSASVVTSAAAVMIGVFSIFATLSLLEFKQLGIGLAAAILIDATIVRIVLLPAAMALLGEWNWWLPRRLTRLPEPAPDEVVRAAPKEPALT